MVQTDNITSALERIADEISSGSSGKLVVKTVIPSFQTFPVPSNVLNRVSYIEEQKKELFLGLIPYKKRKTLVSVSETWFFINPMERRVRVTYIDILAEESARKHLAEYL